MRPPKQVAKKDGTAVAAKRAGKDYTVDADCNITEMSAGRFVDEMMFAFGRYTIEDRAVPDERDGHKPVHRRLVYGLYNIHSTPGNYVKSARVTGDVMGKYHPHGSSYGALVEMTWERYPLINGQGNFGSVMGDPAAADRYSECGVSKLVKHHFACSAIATTVPNYSGEFQEPLIISTRLPLLLMNGTSGIATGTTSKIPSHHLGEICGAFEYVARNWKTATVAGMLEHIKGPDFLYGGVLLSNKQELVDFYTLGAGQLRFSCDYTVEPDPRNASVTLIRVKGFPDPFSFKRFLGTVIPAFRQDGTIVSFTQVYDKKKKDVQFILGVDNPASMKRVLGVLRCTMSYKFNVTRRAGDGSDDGASTEFKSTNLLNHAKYWLLWRKEEEVKLLKLDLSKLDKAKFMEDCKLIGMLNIQTLAEAVQQTRIDPHEYVVKKMKVTREQAETLLKFRLIDLSRLNEKALRDKIKEIIAEILVVKAKIANPMPVVIHYLREVAKDSDARRTRVSNRLADESKMQQSGDPRAMAITSEGKLLGIIDDKSSTNASLFIAPTFTGAAVFGKTSVVSFFGPSSTGKAGPGLETIIGIAPREATYLVALGSDGRLLKVEQDPDNQRSIPVFLKTESLIFGGGAWEDDVLIIWDNDDKCKTIKICDIPTQRKNTTGSKVPGIVPAKAMIARRSQKLMTLTGQDFTVKDPTGINGETCIALGARNMVISGTRRRIMDLKTAMAEVNKGNVTAAFDITLPEAT